MASHHQQKILERLRRLENIVKKPDARLSDLSTCNEPELRRLA